MLTPTSSSRTESVPASKGRTGGGLTHAGPGLAGIFTHQGDDAETGHQLGIQEPALVTRLYDRRAGHVIRRGPPRRRARTARRPAPPARRWRLASVVDSSGGGGGGGGGRAGACCSRQHGRHKHRAAAQRRRHHHPWRKRRSEPQNPIRAQR